MTLTEGMKYGDINVHSVKWVKYHVGNIQLTPTSSWNAAQSESWDFLPPLDQEKKKKEKGKTKAANFNPINSFPLHLSQKRAAEKLCG